MAGHEQRSTTLKKKWKSASFRLAVPPLSPSLFSLLRLSPRSYGSS
ncbi:MAG: hypothetical protein P4M11_15945 [Candidatus Pacebacteria bacterium]|nr:hypothetical protein [Candidatus Paceibacterota bacterium]